MEAFVFADKPYNMNVIVIAWRGTEPFNTWDWSTDIDFSWAWFQNGMAVHLGFLKALGLCHRDDVDSFIKMDNSPKNHDKYTVHQDLLFVLLPSPKKKALTNICVMSFMHVLCIVASIMTRCFNCF
jgi:hypothetical protein